MGRAPHLEASQAELFEGAASEWFDPIGIGGATIDRIGETGVHMVRDRDLIEEVLRREDDFSANLTGVLMRGDDGPLVFELPQSESTMVIATADSPRHRVHRSLVQPSMTPRAVDRLEGKIRSWTEELLDQWVAAGDPEIIEVVETVPARVVGEILGLPQDDVDHFRTWAMTGGTLLGGNVGEDALVALTGETMGMAVYLQQHLDAAAPARPDDDVPMIPLLRGAVERDEISMDEALGVAIVMFSAGGESTAALLGSCLRNLFAGLEQAGALRQDPGLIPAYVDEVARLASPFRFHYRAVRRPCSLGGYDLVDGDRLMLMWSAANRSPGVKDAPSTHLAFGRGQHKCVGEHIARLEARVMVEEFLARVPEADVVDTRYANSIMVLRLESLQIVHQP